MAATRPQALRLRSGLLAALLALAAIHASPLIADTTWQINTVLLEPAIRGATQLTVKDCRGITKQGRLRLSFAEAEEEEAAVASVECPAANLIASRKAPAAPKVETPCDINAAPSTLSPSCKKIAEAARGFRTSYKTAQHASALIPANLAGEGAPAGHSSSLGRRSGSNSMLAQTGSSSRRGGSGAGSSSSSSSSPTVEEGALSYPGVVKLSYGLLFTHSANVSVRGAAPLDAVSAAAAVACPTDAAGQQCSGHGMCELAACLCDTGWGGSTCEMPLCGTSGCGPHGECAGASGCVCADGWSGEQCDKAACVSDCSGHGSCVDGVCSCAAGFHGVDCGAHTAKACKDSCNGNGNCAVAGVGAAPVCLCHSKFVGVACELEIGCPSNCNGNGLCKGGKCQCYQGYSGAECTSFCPHNCTLAPNVFGTLTPRGRCSMDNKCICKDGYSGPDCSQECPSRCFGHGECDDGVCICHEGYMGVDCGRLAPILLMTVFMAAIQGYYPIMFMT